MLHERRAETITMGELGNRDWERVAGSREARETAAKATEETRTEITRARVTEHAGDAPGTDGATMHRRE